MDFIRFYIIYTHNWRAYILPVYIPTVKLYKNNLLKPNNYTLYDLFKKNVSYVIFYH